MTISRVEYTPEAIAGLVAASQAAMAGAPPNVAGNLACALRPFTITPPTWLEFAAERWGPHWYVAVRPPAFGRYAGQRHVIPKEYWLAEAEYRAAFGREP